MSFDGRLLRLLCLKWNSNLTNQPTFLSIRLQFHCQCAHKAFNWISHSKRRLYVGGYTPIVQEHIPLLVNVRSWKGYIGPLVFIHSDPFLWRTSSRSITQSHYSHFSPPFCSTCHFLCALLVFKNVSHLVVC